MPPATPVPSLPEELLEEVLLRLPPDEPAFLVRASLASKLWLGLLTGPSFRGRYRDFHGTPPMLGFVYSFSLNSVRTSEYPLPHFVSTTKFAPRVTDERRETWEYDAWDCRHGRVLLRCKHAMNTTLFVWDPMTGCWTALHPPTKYMQADSHGAAVLCAVTGCDHRACHQGPFRMVFLYIDEDEDGDAWNAYTIIFSSETGKWSEPSSGFNLAADAFIEPLPPVLVEGALHFMLEYVYHRVGILKYDLGSNCLSLIDAPLEGSVVAGAVILIAMEDGSLGFAHLKSFTLHLWSRQISSEGVGSWTQRTIIHLGNGLLPIQSPNTGLGLIGSSEGSDVIFLTMDDLGIYEINLKMLQWKELLKRAHVCALIPYKSFYNPPTTPTPTLTTRKDKTL